MADQLIAIEMAAHTWWAIDGGMDNAQNLARAEYWERTGDFGPDPADPEVGPIARFANEIREEGWRQVPGAWKLPCEQWIALRLTREQWEFIRNDAAHSLPIYRDLAARPSRPQSHNEMVASVESCERIIALVGGELGRIQ